MAKEYIEREALLHKIRWASSAEEAVMSVRRIPAADVVPVIHCKDCVYAQPLKDSKYDYLCRYWNGHSCNQNQFCSQGKRKEDENEKKDTNDK